MSAFTARELDYLLGQRRLARLATAGADGTPHVVPVGWRFNAELDAIEISGRDLWGIEGGGRVSHTVEMDGRPA